MNKRIIVGLLFTLAGVTVFLSQSSVQEKQIIVMIPSYNNVKHYQKNLESVFSQKHGNRPYKNWSLVYTDDCSSDGTYEAVKSFVAEKGMEQHCTIIENEVRRGAMANHYRAIHECPDNAIIVALDGDDWLAHDHVFERLNDIYQDPKVWLTYGQYQEYPSGKIGHCIELPEQVRAYNLIRNIPFVTSHLRTFYAGLFKQIKKEDLMHNNDFFQITSDLAFMFPMVEMAGEHVRFVPEVLCVYNMNNPINDFKKDISGLLAMERVIRNKQRYARRDSFASNLYPSPDASLAARAQA